MADDIMGMLSGMFGGGTPQPTDPNAPMQILPQVQQDAMSGQPSFLDLLKAKIGQNGPQAFGQMASQLQQQNRPAQVPPMQPMNIPQAPRPAYGSMMPMMKIGQ